MKNLFIVLVLFVFTLSSAVYAQSLNSIGKTYDKASELLAEGDTADAIKSLKKVIDMCEGQGDIGECIKLTSETKIVELYIIEGQQAYRKKKFDAALTAYDVAGTYAESINDPELTSQLKDYTMATYIGKAEALYDATKYKKATEQYLEIIEMDSRYTNAYYGLLLTYIKLDEGGKIEDTEKKIRDISNDNALKEKARMATAIYYSDKSMEALRKQEYNIASMMASKSLVYDNSNHEVYYSLAQINNIRKDWVNAEKAASRAIRLSKGSNPDYFYELGLANEGAGNTEKACEAFLKVSSGDKKSMAQSKASRLNCN